MKRIPRTDCPTPLSLSVLPPRPEPGRPHRKELQTLLLGPGSDGLELPPMTDLVATVLALAEGKRRKVILPLASSTGEFAFVRRAEHVLLSYYDSGPVPQIFLRDRPIDLSRLVAACGLAALEMHELAALSSNDRTGLLLAERALRAAVKPDRTPAQPFVLKRGGAQAAAEEAPLSFGFSAKIPQ